MLADNAALITNNANPPFTSFIAGKNCTENGIVADAGENPNTPIEQAR